MYTTIVGSQLGAKIMPGEKQSFSAEEKEYARALMHALEPFRAIRSTMPLQHVYTYLMVVLDEGLTVKEYADKVGVSQSVMTRHLLDIGERNRAKEAGFGLIKRANDAMDLRKNRTSLTNKGVALFNQVIRALEPLRRLGEKRK